jgi:hypothetical protein
MNSETSTSALEIKKILLFLHWTLVRQSITYRVYFLWCLSLWTVVIEVCACVCVCVCLCVCVCVCVRERERQRERACYNKLNLCLSYCIGIKNRRLGYAVLHIFLGFCKYIVGYLANTVQAKIAFLHTPPQSFIHNHSTILRYMQQVKLVNKCKICGKNKS